MTSNVTSATVNDVKFASGTENINPLTMSDIKAGFSGCDGKGIQMTSANFNAVLNWLTENIGVGDFSVEEIEGEKYLTIKGKDGSIAKIKLAAIAESLRSSGVITQEDLTIFQDAFSHDVLKAVSI